MLYHSDPFVAYHSARFLLWELSTPFLNIHWMLDKTGQTGSPLQLVNDLIMSCQVFETLFEARDGLSSAVLAGLCVRAHGPKWAKRILVHEDDGRAPETLQ
jgi:hypothetical protein